MLYGSCDTLHDASPTAAQAGQSSAAAAHCAKLRCLRGVRTRLVERQLLCAAATLSRHRLRPCQSPLPGASRLVPVPAALAFRLAPLHAGHIAHRVEGLAGGHMHPSAIPPHVLSERPSWRQRHFLQTSKSFAIKPPSGRGCRHARGNAGKARLASMKRAAPLSAGAGRSAPPA